MKNRNTSSFTDLPEFENPPVVEVVLGIQFRPLFQLRSIDLSSLREEWRKDFPHVQEQSPLPTETSQDSTPNIQFVIGPPMSSRLWFLNEDKTILLQLQHDRFLVNWRKISSSSSYPHYPSVKETFLTRFEQLQNFIHTYYKNSIEITQIEVTYVNKIDQNNNDIDQIFRFWKPVTEHHLGSPSVIQSNLVFDIQKQNGTPIKMHVAIHPSQQSQNIPGIFFNLSVKGKPLESTIQSALNLMDEAHFHIVNSFTELTSSSMHKLWRKTK